MSPKIEPHKHVPSEHEDPGIADDLSRVWVRFCTLCGKSLATRPREES